MSIRRTHIVSEFLAKAAERELRRLWQIRALENLGGAWKDKDHQELRAGATPWVKKLRKESGGRLQKRTGR